MYQIQTYSNVLFPNAKEGYYNLKIIRKRIQKYLEPEDYNWAFDFTNSIVEHHDYNQIKKNLSRLPLEVLKKYHECLQHVLDNSNYSPDFLNILDEFILINSKKQVFANSVLGIRLPDIDDRESMKNIGRIIEEVGNKLLKENNDIINNAYKLFDDEFVWAKEKEYLEYYIELQRQDLKKLIINEYRNLVILYKRKIDINSKKDINYHFYEEHVKILKLQKHMKGRNYSLNKNYKK